jgi:signal transduction histidine kinase
MTVLVAVITRVAVIVRTVAVGYVAVQVLIWHSFYAARPWLLLGPAAAMAWGASVVAYLRHHQPGWRFICADTAGYLALALAAGWCLPLAVRGEAGNWLFIVVVSQFTLPIWFAPAVLSVPLALASVTAFWVGMALAPLGADMRRDAVASGLLMFAVAAMHWVGRRMLYARAIQADLALTAADLDARGQYVILSRTIERREHERLLHDTVLNTLTAISRAGRPEAVVARCQRDIRVLERMLSEPEDPTAAVRSGDGLLAGIEAVASEMRGRGLEVHVEAQSSGTAEPGEPEGPAIPVPVAEAITQAAREALANVVAHAGTGEAWVTVGLTAPGDAAARSAGLRVTIRDEGVGFDPARVGPARLGLRRSIIERVADWGGSVSVQSAPGEGTVVTLSWAASPATVPGAFPAAGDRAGQGASPW